MKVAVCDDDPKDLRQIAEMISRVAGQEGFQYSLTTYESGGKLLKDIEEGLQFHVLLLDVMMDEMSGMELAAELRRRQNNAQIVFISFSRDMAVCGYEVSAARYLLKPIDTEKLREALVYCYNKCESSRKIIVTTARGMRKLAIDKLVYAETWGRGLRLIMTDGYEDVSMKMSDLEEMLPSDQFVMTHRTILLNLAYVRYLRYCEIELKTGIILPVSKYRQNDTREKFVRYLEG
jgi:DNA-binding LytR/AlgR family response regulator